MTDASIQVLGILRSTENLQWYIVPLITWSSIFTIWNLKKRTSTGADGDILLATSGVCMEIINALVLHFTGIPPSGRPRAFGLRHLRRMERRNIFLAAVGGVSVLTGLPRKARTSWH
jgi:hypothetical protein